MTEEVSNVDDIRISAEMQELLGQLETLGTTAKELITKIEDQGHKDGLTDKEIDKLMRYALESRNLSDRQIRRLLPDKFKNETMQQVAKASKQPKVIAADKMSANLPLVSGKTQPIDITPQKPVIQEAEIVQPDEPEDFIVTLNYHKFRTEIMMAVKNKSILTMKCNGSNHEVIEVV